jgi:O-antigen/teichoic acid export membrane protein
MSAVPPARPASTGEKTLKNILLLGSGSASGQAMVILTSPILTRLFDVQAFGIYAIFSAIVNSIASAACLKFEQAILLEKAEPGADMVLRLCVVVSLMVSAAGLMGFILLDFVAISDAYKRSAPLLMEFGALNIFSLGLFNGLYFWFTRRGDFRGLGIYQFSRSLVAVVLQLLFSLIGRKAVYLVMGQVIGLIIATILLLVLGRGRVHRILGRGYDVGEMARLAARYKTFPMYGAPQVLGRLISQNLPALLLPVFFGPAQSGLYWLAYRMLIMPSQIVVESTRSVFFREAAEIHRDRGDLRRAMLRPAIYLGLFSLAVSAGLWVAGPFLFGLVFGPQWREAGLYAALISISWGFENIGLSTSVIISLLEMQRFYLIAEIISLFARSLAIFIGYKLGSAEYAVGLYVATAVISSIFIMGYVYAVLSRRPKPEAS